jgi:hypothetical protein
MPVLQKASKLIALSAFALSATLFHATTLRAATTAADTAAAASTSADATAATTATDTAAVSTSADAAPTATVATPEPQAAAPAPAPAPAAPAAPPTWSVGPISFSGLVDFYYDYSANRPVFCCANGYDFPENNSLRQFDTATNAFALSMVKLSMSYAPAPVGFQVDMMYGPSADNNFPDNLEQAYIAWKPTKGKGFEADFGQFVTSAGAEVIESMNDTNYSRSLLFTELIPLYHVGLRTSMPITKKETVGFQLVNGFNGSLSNDTNAGKTIGLTSLYTATNWNWALNYYVGPENAGTDKGKRNLIDTTLNLTPAKLAKITGYINYDYYQNRNANCGSGTCVTTNLTHEQGIAVEGRYQATGTVAFSGRYEYVYDGSGAITNVTKASLNEFTITGEYKMSQGLVARLEYRRDHTDNPFFVKGEDGGNPRNYVKSQSTLQLGIVAFFGPAH